MVATIIIMQYFPPCLCNRFVTAIMVSYYVIEGYVVDQGAHWVDGIENNGQIFSMQTDCGDCIQQYYIAC